MKKRLILLFISLLLAACSSGGGQEETAVTANAAAPTAELAAAIVEPAPEGAVPPGYEGKTWADIVAQANGQTVNFYMWGGSDLINTWVTAYVATAVQEQYGVTLNMVPISDATEYINKVLGEKEAGQDSGGSVDLVWVNGENFRTMRQQDLFANSEVSFDMAYNPAEASSLVENGRYPATTRTFVFDSGTIANTHYVAIPYNSDHKAAAMVVANFLLSPAAQLSKAQPENWGDLPALDPALLPADLQSQFAAIPRGAATLSTEELAAYRLPELQAPWLVAFEQGWEAEVLQK